MSEAVIVCPACGEEVSPANTLWTWLGKWYCSERCVRKAQKP